VVLVAAQRIVSDGGMHASFPMNVAYPPMSIFEPLREVREPFRVVGQGVAFIPGMSALYGLEDVRGYEAMTFEPLFATYPLWCVHQSAFFNRVDDITRPFLTMMNVRFAFAGEWLPVPPGWRLVAKQAHVILLENTNVMPRAFVPANVSVGLTDAETIEKMKSIGDFRERAWITADVPPFEQSNGPGTLSIRRTKRRGFEVDADMQNDGWIVLTESAWKGWRAYVDGRRTGIHRANVAFLGVNVPRGRHLVRFVYWPESFVRGRAISGATLLGIAVFAVARRSRRRRRGPSPGLRPPSPAAAGEGHSG
jgi:hypothetical protein